MIRVTSKFYDKMFRGFRDIERFLKTFFPSKSLHIHFNPSQNVSYILLLNDIVVVTNDTSWKVSKYEVFSDPYFPVFGLNTGKYGPEKAPYLDTFHAVWRVDFSQTFQTRRRRTIFNYSVIFRTYPKYFNFCGKLNLIYKFRFVWIHGKMFNNTHMV